MLVAGSVIALLLMGLAVEAVIEPAEDLGDVDDDDLDQPDGSIEASGEVDGDALVELLADHDVVNHGPETVAADASPNHLNLLTQDGDADAEPDLAEPTIPVEARADADWSDLSEQAPDDGLIEVELLTDLEDGSEVAYVDEFRPETDMLVLEFDGAEGEEPKIDVDCELEEGASVVMADGVPVTLVEGVEEMGPENVRVIMCGDEHAAPDKFQAEAVENPDPDAGIVDDVTAALMDGGTSQDVMDARAGIDEVFGTGGGDAFTGSHNADTITGTDMADALHGDEGDDSLFGGSGNDELHGDTGDDTLIGADGVDFLSGGEGDDDLDGGTGADLLFGGDGSDDLQGGADDDFLQGGSGSDSMNGGSGDDILDGSFLDADGMDQDWGDTLSGGDGDDTILVGAWDLAVGGDGADVFTSGDYIDASHEAGTVTDFDPTEDRIEVIYDPKTTPDPQISVQDLADGSGAEVLMNGEVILNVYGGQGMDAGAIELRATG